MRLIFLALCWVVGFSTATLGSEPIKILGINFQMSVSEIQKELSENANMKCETEVRSDGFAWHCDPGTGGFGHKGVYSSNYFAVSKKYEGIRIYCEAFNGCSYRIREVAKAISEKFDLDREFVSWSYYDSISARHTDHPAYVLDDEFGNRIFVIKWDRKPMIYLTDSPTKLKF